MIFAIFVLLVGLTISIVAEYYSIVGLMAIFAASPLAVAVMGASLALGKLTSTVWLKINWNRTPILFKCYLMLAITLLMFLTTIGCFGFLAKAHTDQNLVSGDVLDRLAIIEEKIKTQKDNLDAARKALTQMDSAVDQTLARSTSEGGAGRSAQLRKSQSKERSLLRAEIEKAQLTIAELNNERSPIANNLRKVEAEVGPIKYIAAFVYGDNPDQNILERAVTWIIIMIVIVFDPLAVVMLLAAQMTFSWSKPIEPKVVDLQPEVIEQEIDDIPIKVYHDKESTIEKEARRYHPVNKPIFVKLPQDETTSTTRQKVIITNDKIGLKPIDFLYKEYNKDQFRGLNYNPEEEPELAKFITNSQASAKFNNYSSDILEYFARRIYEFRENHINNAT